jgi:hypothetical protein
VGVAAAAAICVLLLPLQSIVLWAIATAIYVAVLLALRALPPELLHVLRRTRG